MADDSVIHHLSAPTPMERVHVPQLAAIAVIGAGFGLALAYGLARPAAESQLPPAHARVQTDVSAITAQTAAASAKPVPSVAAHKAVATHHAVAQNALPMAAPVDAAQNAPAAQPAQPPQPAESAPQTAAAAAVEQPALAVSSPRPNRPASQREFAPGMIVYWRCDGLERPGQRFPCPRDRRLEANVWKTLEMLRQCRDANPGTGQAELRLTLHRGVPPQFELSHPGRGRSLNLRAVGQCAGDDLTKLRSRLRSPHAVVTFAFGIS